MQNRDDLIRAQIAEARKKVNYNTVLYPLKCLIDSIDRSQIKNNFYWDEVKQSYFIESLILGLPVLKIVFVDKNWQAVGKTIELIDGKQRLYTAINFAEGNLEVCGLKTLTALNGKGFSDLGLSSRKKFMRTSVGAIVLDPKSDLSIWRKITEIN